MRVAREAQREDGAAWWDVEKRRRESRAYVEAAIRRVATRNMHMRKHRMEQLTQAVWAVVALRQAAVVESAAAALRPQEAWAAAEAVSAQVVAV